MKRPGRASAVAWVAAAGVLFAVVPSGLCVAHGGQGPTVSAAPSPSPSPQERSQTRRSRKEPTELWNLYPLNPLGGRTPAPDEQSSQPSPTPTDEALAEGPVPSTDPDDAERQRSAAQPATERSGGTRSTPILVVAGLAVALAAWLLARQATTRGRRPPIPAPTAPAGAAPAGWVEPPRGQKAPTRADADRVIDLTEEQRPRVHSTPKERAPAAERPQERAPAAERAQNGGPTGEHVRVHLSDGRRIEGWKRDSRSTDQRVLILDVEVVYDASGREVGSTPLDRFLLPPQIERIEPLD